MGFLSDLFGGSSSNEPAPTQEERALAESGAKNWNRYVRDIVPVSGRFADLTRAGDGDRAMVNRGVINSVRDENYSRGLTNALRRNPLSVGAAAMSVQRSNDAANSAIAAGVTQGASQLLDREARGLLSLASSGRQLQNTGTQTLGAAGRNAQEVAIAQGRNDRAFAQGLVSGASTIGGYYAGQRAGTGGWFGGDA